MFGKVFGKRGVDAFAAPSPPAPMHPSPDRDGVTRALPKELWNGSSGDMLRQLGMSPDDESNLVLTPEKARANAKELENSLNAVVAHVNDELANGCSVLPWARIPWSVWSMDSAEFLMKACCAYPAALWNNMLLPADAKSAAILGLPQHPRVAVRDLDIDANRLIGQLRDEFQIQHQQTALALQKGDMSALSKVEEQRQKRLSNVGGLASYLGGHVFGEDARKRHDQLFGFGLEKCLN